MAPLPFHHRRAIPDASGDEDNFRLGEVRIAFRPIPPSDPDFPRLYGRRDDSGSLNRGLEDTLFLGRAHSLGWRRQQVEMTGWALMVNALTMVRTGPQTPC
jgi:hypothetical protein